MLREAGDNLISIENAVVAYRDRVALRGVSLEVTAGDFLGIVGPNGAGKTTLLSLVNGFRVPQSGRVAVLGRSTDGSSRNALRKHVGYLPQVNATDVRMPMTVSDVVMVGRYGMLGLFRRPGRRDREVVAEMLEVVGADHLAKRPIGHLSGGERQRVAVARCLAQEPEILLLDEPTASLDWKAQVGILELVARIHSERSLTVLFVTHDLTALPTACDRIVLLKDGLVFGDGRRAELLGDETLGRLYDVPASAVRDRRERGTLA